MKHVLLITISFFSFYLLKAQNGDGCTKAISINDGSYIVDTMMSGAATFAKESPFPTRAKWFKYVPTQDGLLTLSTCGGGSDTRVFMYSGNCDTLKPFAFNDDYCAMNAQGDQYASNITKPVKAGMTYYIEFDNAWDSSRFTFNVSVSTYTAKSGQSCQSAIALKNGTTKVDSLFGFATRGDATRANWYKFTAPSTGKISIGSCGDIVDTRLFMYDACDVTRAILESDDNCLSSEIDTLAASITGFSVVAGKTYYFEFDDGNENLPFSFDFTFDGLSPTEDLAFSRNISVSPNPANDILNVNFNFEENTDVSLKLITTIGQEVFNKKIDNQLRGSEIIDTQNLKNGIYFLQIKEGSRIANKKIIISH